MKNLINYKFNLINVPFRAINIVNIVSLLAYSACSTNSLEEMPPSTCYEGVVVRDKTNACDFVVQIQNGKLGEKWDNLDNCIHIKNLPTESQKTGSKIYFQSYKVTESPFCLDNKLELPKSIIIENYSSLKCL
jgi:hypothetical protein